MREVLESKPGAAACNAGAARSFRFWGAINRGNDRVRTAAGGGLGGGGGGGNALFRRVQESPSGSCAFPVGS